MPRRHRGRSAEFKRQVVAECYAGETPHALSRRHELSRNLVGIRAEKAEPGAFDDEEAAADSLAACEARIAAPERLVGRQALEIVFPKGRPAPGPRGEARPDP